jgi:hypothetical protein
MRIKVKKTAQRDPKELIKLANHYYKMPIDKTHKNTIIFFKIVSLISLKRWDDIRPTIDLLYFKKLKKHTIKNSYIKLILALFNNAEIEDGNYMLTKVSDFKYLPEVNLAFAINDYYHYGDKKEIKQLLYNIGPNSFNSFYKGYLYYYLSLMSVSEERVRYLNMAKEFGSEFISQRAEKALNSNKGKGAKNG